MCGIAGIISHNNIPGHYLRDMSSAMLYRGPEVSAICCIPSMMV